MTTELAAPQPRARSSMSLTPEPVKTVIVRLTGGPVWRLYFDRAAEQWGAVCDELKLTASGSTALELQEDCLEALNFVLRYPFQDGTIEKFLETHRWVMEQPAPPADVPVEFDAPIHWVHIEEARRAHG